jgi:2-succinyl-5-enolpyruvyl-6-hydroxy-3-cyclohexene-1-carboxylate synthase
VIPYYDIFLRSENLAALAPDSILSLGAVPSSRPLREYLARHRSAHTIQIQSQPYQRDPEIEEVDSDVIPFCEALTSFPRPARDSLLYDPFQRAAQTIRIELSVHAPENSEAAYVHEAVRKISDDSNLVLANSMSIRYADALCACEGKRIHAFALRGVSGIDGTISHAAGIAAASGKPTLLITGDLAFLHDLNGLHVAKSYAPNLDILLLNNNGGGIFHFLPIHEYGEPFETIHGTPHNANLEALKDVFGIQWVTDSPPFTGGQGGVRVHEIRTDRETNHTAWLKCVNDLLALLQ